MNSAWSNIRQLIRDGESTTTEFKRSMDLKKIGPALAAFANTDGGILVLGVEDDRRIVGIAENTEKARERLTSFLQNGLSSPLQAQLHHHASPEGIVHWIDVTRQRGFEPMRYNGRVYVRRGRANVEPSPQHLQELYNAYGYILTEEQTIQAATSKAIDLSAFKSYLERLGLDLETAPQPEMDRDLRTRGVLAESGGQLHATLYGVLAFGKLPQDYPQTQNFWIECVSYNGTSRGDDVLEVAEAKGRLNEQVERALGWLKGQPKQERYEGIERQDIPLLPQKALREVLVNAVAHRDYTIMGSKIMVERFKDRVDITTRAISPTALPPNPSKMAAIRGPAINPSPTT